MKEYNRLIKEIEKDPDFEIEKSGRKSTIKVIHVYTRQLYSVHPGKNAVFPLSKWIKKFK
jgi:hypothetical protein